MGGGGGMGAGSGEMLTTIESSTLSRCEECGEGSSGAIREVRQEKSVGDTDFWRWQQKCKI